MPNECERSQPCGCAGQPEPPSPHRSIGNSGDVSARSRPRYNVRLAAFLQYDARLSAGLVDEGGFRHNLFDCVTLGEQLYGDVSDIGLRGKPIGKPCFFQLCRVPGAQPICVRVAETQSV